jgi:cell division protein FtsB
MCSTIIQLPTVVPDTDPAGTAGGEAQQADIRQLLKELELKKAKLNELKGDSRKTESAIAKIRDDDTDAQRLTPDDCVEENAYIQVWCCPTQSLTSSSTAQQVLHQQTVMSSSGFKCRSQSLHLHSLSSCMVLLCPCLRLLLLPLLVQSLRDEMTRVEEDLLEADAKNRLYYLLGERTRREHMAIDQKVRATLPRHSCVAYSSKHG